MKGKEADASCYMASSVSGNLNQIWRCDWLAKPPARWTPVSRNKNVPEVEAGCQSLSFVICAVKNDFFVTA